MSQATAKAPLLAALFYIALIMPLEFSVTVGGLRLSPYRVLLLVVFISLALKLLQERRQPMNLVDGLIAAHAGWVVLALTALTFGVPANASGESPDGVGDRGQAPAPPAGKAAGARRRQAPPPPPLGVRFGESLEGRRFRLAYTFEQERLAGLPTGTDSLSPAD